MKLKNIDTYFNKILDYCKVIGVEVFENKDVDFCEFGTHLRQIHYNPQTVKNANLISSLLHELGHLHDDLESKKKFDKKYLKGAEKIHENLYVSESQYKIVVRCEKMAWKKAEVIAKLLKIPLGKWFYNYKKLCIMSYTNHKKRLDKVN